MPGPLDDFLKNVIKNQKSGGAPAADAQQSSGGFVGEPLPSTEDESENFQGLSMVEFKQGYLDNIKDMLLDQVAGIKNPGLLIIPFSVPMRHYTGVQELGGYETSTTIGDQFSIKLPPLVNPNNSIDPQEKYFPYNLVLNKGEDTYVTIDPLRAYAFSSFAYTLFAKEGSYAALTRITIQFKGQKSIYPNLVYEVFKSEWSGKSYDPIYETIKIGGNSDSPLIQGINYNEIFEGILQTYMTPKRDATFTLYKPMGEVAYQEEAANVIGLSDPVNISGKYNYYLQPYEKLISKESEYISLRVYGENLPNIYGMIYDEQNATKVYYDQWALNSNKIYPEDEPLKFKTNFKDYFNNFAQFLFGFEYTEDEQSNETIAFNTLSKKYSTVGVSAYSMPYFTDQAEKMKEMFYRY